MTAANRFRPSIGALLAVCALAACASPVAPTAAPLPPNSLPPSTTPTALPTATPLATPSLAIAATSVTLDDPVGLALRPDGTLYFSLFPINSLQHQVFKIDPLGLLSIYAGRESSGYSGDGGAATAALFNGLSGIALDQDGNLYAADQVNNRIRRIDTTGIVTTVAGDGIADYSGDGGPAAAARLNQPCDVAFDAAGNLYIVDQFNNRIRKVDRRGIITTVAGDGSLGFSGDGGPANAAQLSLAHINTSIGIAFDPQGSLYIVDGGSARIRKVDPQGIITTIAGTGEQGIAGDGGPATAAQFTRPSGIAIDSRGNIFIADTPSPLLFNNRVRKIDPQGIITTFAGAGSAPDLGDGGPAVAAQLRYVSYLAVDAVGNLYISDSLNGRIRRVDQNGIIATIAGGRP